MACFALDGTLVNCVEDDFEDASPIDKNIQIASNYTLLGIRSSSGPTGRGAGTLVQPWLGPARSRSGS